MRPDLTSKYPETSFESVLDQALSFMPESGTVILIGRICDAGTDWNLAAPMVPLYRQDDDAEAPAAAYLPSPHMNHSGKKHMINFRVFDPAANTSTNPRIVEPAGVKKIFDFINTLMIEGACDFNLHILPKLQLVVGPIAGYTFRLEMATFDLNRWAGFIQNPKMWINNFQHFPSTMPYGSPLGDAFTLQITRDFEEKTLVTQEEQPDVNKETEQWFNQQWGRSDKQVWDYGAYVNHFNPVGLDPLRSKAFQQPNLIDVLLPEDTEIFMPISSTALMTTKQELGATFPWEEFLGILTSNNNAQLVRAWNQAKENLKGKAATSGNLIQAMVNVLLAGARRMLILRDSQQIAPNVTDHHDTITSPYQKGQMLESRIKNEILKQALELAKQQIGDSHQWRLFEQYVLIAGTDAVVLEILKILLRQNNIQMTDEFLLNVATSHLVSLAKSWGGLQNGADPIPMKDAPAQQQPVADNDLMAQAMQDVTSSYDPNATPPILDNPDDMVIQAKETERAKATAEMDANLKEMQDQLNQMVEQQKRELEKETAVEVPVSDTPEDRQVEDQYFSGVTDLKDDDDLAKDRPESESNSD